MRNVSARAADLVAQLEALHDEMRREHDARAPDLERIHVCHREGAANLVDYLTLRGHDIRPLQTSLAELGLSSLGRAEEHVITSVERVLAALYRMASREDERITEAAVGFGEGRRALERNAEALLGPCRAGRSTRILVTMPGEAAEDPDLARRLIEHGMDCARINCAHDDRARWTRMVDHLDRAAADTRRTCRILMDLPGPKLRTGPIEPGPGVLRLRPPRDALGRAVAPVRAVLVAEELPIGLQPELHPEPGTPRIPVPGDWQCGLRKGDKVRLRDTRDSARTLEVVEVGPAGVVVEVSDTTYLVTGTGLVGPNGRSAPVGDLPRLEQALVLHVGDTLTLTADLSPASPDGLPERRSAGSPGAAGPGATAAKRFSLGCTLPVALAAVRPGDRVLFDDGKIGGMVVGVEPDRAGEVDVVITAARAGGSKLRAEKGINMPDSDLHLPALGPADEPILRFVVEHADLVGLSFAQDPADIRTLQRRLAEFGREHVGIVLKVETARGFSVLPQMLLAAMESERVGVMVARGDLAVECGFERLAEIQEEILWLCDAAHIPVIWATQVLDQMAKSGQPSRAEISDAAMAVRAECVMLNKGPRILDAVSALDDILRRMGGHQRKKESLLRRLQSWPPGGSATQQT